MISSMRHAQIYDGQYHEDESLQGDDQQMKNQPRQIQHYLQRQPKQSSPSHRKRAADQGNQQKHQFASKQVAEQAQSQAQRFGQLFDQRHHDIDRYEKLAERMKQE